MEKVLAENIVFTGSFLKIQRDQVELPNGSQATREYVIHPGAAMIIPILNNGQLLMIDQYRHSLKKNFLEFPAGKRDSSEDTLETAKRELKEETGHEAKYWKKLTTIHPVIGYSNEFIDIYLAKELSETGPMSHEPGEHIQLKKMNPSELKKLIETHKLTDVKSQIGAFWYLNYLMTPPL